MNCHLRSRRLVLGALLAVITGLATAIPAPAYFGCTATPALSTVYLNWFDNASAGMVADNIHILNAGTKPFSGCVTVGGGPGVTFGVSGGQETYVTMPAGTYGGPVRVTITAMLDQAVMLASQRVQFHSSFNELRAADPSQALTTGYFNWYDKASPGMLNDNIHVLNPGTATANVTVSLPGAASQVVAVGAGAEAYVSFPQGTMGGPVKVSSDQPVLASQRVQFDQSFSEEWAQSAAQAVTLNYFSWFDRTSPGVAYDNIHLLNPGTIAANATISMACSLPVTIVIPPGGESHGTIPAGTLCTHPINCVPPLQCGVPMGGPLAVRSDQPLLASQRVQFYSSFDEIWAAGTAQAATTSHFNWYDRASPGMLNDNVHVFNPTAINATVTVSVPGGTPQTVILGFEGERYFNFPGTIGGPVTVSSDQPVLASQRVQYYQSFSESWAL
jgi:hypothetical protein